MVYPLPDAVQYTAAQENAMNMASVQPWEIANTSSSGKDQSSLSNAPGYSWAASLENIQPSVQAQMMGDNSAQVSQAQVGQYLAQNLGQYQPGVDIVADVLAAGGSVGGQNYMGTSTKEALSSPSAAANAVVTGAKTLAGSVSGVVSGAAADWLPVINETVTRVVLAVLALLVIFLALRKMV
jgi:hypothetical protein